MLQIADKSLLFTSKTIREIWSKQSGPLSPPLKQGREERPPTISISGVGLHMEVDDALVARSGEEKGLLVFLMPDESADNLWSPTVELDSRCLYSFAAVFHTEAEDTTSNPRLHHGERKGRTRPCPKSKSASNW
jgi:hypothetical protein